MKEPPDEMRVVIKWPQGMHLPHPLELMRPRSGTLSPEIEAKILHTVAFFETFQNLFGYPDRPAPPIRRIRGEAEPTKLDDPLEWHANTLARLRQT
jgi:hypothetical protein